MRGIPFLIALLLVSACSRDEGASASQVDPSQLTSSGEVELADGGRMAFNITSERYKQWDQARRAFPKALITRFGQVLQPRSPTEASINAAVALLERDPRARQAIEQAGLSVRGFVEITVALEQQMMLASTRGERVDPVPAPETYPLSMDSGYYPIPAPAPYPEPVPAAPLPYPYTPAPVVPAPVTPLPATPYPAPDSVRRDTIVRPAPPAPRPDTTSPRRDTAPVRRDSVVPPKPPSRDTVRDTSRVIPPDSLPRA
ncbi:MAG TPA: hypothetical protein VFO66_00075 [Gemmatimonadaceae bacterium]|nr:hypothetical protein [Gemmatimonadaceae bacterium]